MHSAPSKGRFRYAIALMLGVLLVTYFALKIQYVRMAVELGQDQQVMGPTGLAAK